MQEPQPNLRIAASRAFMESLDELHNILAQERQTAESEPHRSGDRESSSWPDLNLLEEAAADLDEYFGDAQLPEEG